MKNTYALSEPEDLWKIYKAVKQRYSRSVNPSQKCLAEVYKDAMKLVLSSPTIDNAFDFSEKEQQYLDHPNTRQNSKAYSHRVISALINNNFINSKPQINIGDLTGCLPDRTPEDGYIYIAISDFRPNQLKIGYTTLPIKKRLQLYKSRYGYKLEAVHYAQVEFPSKIEMHAQKRLSAFRVSGLTNGDSNEWYNCDVDLAVNIIELVAEENDLLIFAHTW